jgi:tyrosine aminotransferase
VAAAFKDEAAITAIVPQGAMYCMLGINFEVLDTEFVNNDADFARLLLQEENLFVLPGQCFSLDNYVRLVLCCPAETAMDACDRLKSFCARHLRR